MLIFENPGLIDETAATVMGVNAKEGDAIGQFGTGLKYSVATILRLGGTIEIWRGLTRLRFAAEAKTIRGKEFQIVTLEKGTEKKSFSKPRELGYTTEYGKNWEPWMIYRELWSNCRDEGGTVRRVEEFDSASMTAPKKTVIVVNCPEIEKAHEERHRIILQTEALVTCPGLEIHAGESEFVYYRGIRVHKFQKKTMYTYNLTAEHSLTEDRTLLLSWRLDSILGKGIIQCTNMTVLTDILRSRDEKQRNDFEATIKWTELSGTTPSPQFLEVCGTLLEQKSLLPSARRMYDDHRESTPGFTSPYIVTPTPLEEDVINRAIDVVNGKFPFLSIQRGQILVKTRVGVGGRATVGYDSSITVEQSEVLKGVDSLARVLLLSAIEARVPRGYTTQSVLVHLLLHGHLPVADRGAESLRRTPELAYEELPF